MLVPMKMPLTENDIGLMIYAGKPKYFIGPKMKLKSLVTLITEFDFRPVELTEKMEKVEREPGIPWEVVAKDRIEKYGEAGLALKGARARDDWTQAALAKKLGIAQYNLSKMENGKRPIGKKMAKRLAKIFKTDYRVFL